MARDATPTGGRNLSAPHDLMPGSGDEQRRDPRRGRARSSPSTDGRWLAFSAPIDGAYELWRIAVADGRVERLTEGRHYISGWDAVPARRGGGAMRIAYLRSTPTEPPDLWLLDAGRTVDGEAAPPDVVQRRGPRRARAPRADRAPRRRSTAATSRAGSSRPATAPRPLVVEIHGGPHTLYGWSPSWEFQVLAAAGIGVFYCNPRGSEGYGEAFNDANHRDWGPGPMRDVLAGVDALVADGLADPDRLGVTGGSYGGYLTNWIVAHDQRFRAAMTCRSRQRHGRAVPDRRHHRRRLGDGSSSTRRRGTTRPTSARSRRSPTPIDIRTPLLIQHSERDLRTTIAQAEALFTVLRSLRRPVRLLRVPEETHELTRSGTPFRRVENLRSSSRLVPPLPGRRQARPAAAPEGPRRALRRSRDDRRASA